MMSFTFAVFGKHLEDDLRMRLEDKKPIQDLFMQILQVTLRCLGRNGYWNVGKSLNQILGRTKMEQRKTGRQFNKKLRVETLPSKPKNFRLERVPF